MPVLSGQSKILTVDNSRYGFETLNWNDYGGGSSGLQYNRRIHIDGFQMLDVKYNEHEHRQKMMAIENRVQRLEYEEKRAKRLHDIAEKRAKDLQDTRKRHFEDMENKRKYNDAKLQELNQQRDRINKERKDRADNIKNQRLRTMTKNWNDKTDTNDQTNSGLAYRNQQISDEMARKRQLSQYHSSADRKTFDQKFVKAHKDSSENRHDYSVRMHESLQK